MLGSGFKIAGFIKLLLMLLGSFVVNGDHSEIMKELSAAVGAQVRPCIEELGLGTKVLQDIQHYWDPGYQLTDQNIGCALICASNKLHLLQDNGDLDPYYAATFVRSAGGDELMVKTLTDLHIACWLRSSAPHPCARSLEATNCFRGSIQQSAWLPHIELPPARRCGEDVMVMEELP